MPLRCYDYWSGCPEYWSGLSRTLLFWNFNVSRCTRDVWSQRNLGHTRKILHLVHHTERYYELIHFVLYQGWP